MDNVWLESTIVHIGYECPKCGHEGHEEVDGTMMQGVCVEVHDHNCASCGFNVFDEYNEEDDEDE